LRHPIILLSARYARNATELLTNNNKLQMVSTRSNSQEPAPRDGYEIDMFEEDNAPVSDTQIEVEREKNATSEKHGTKRSREEEVEEDTEKKVEDVESVEDSTENNDSCTKKRRRMSMEDRAEKLDAQLEAISKYTRTPAYNLNAAGHAVIAYVNGKAGKRVERLFMDPSKRANKSTTIENVYNELVAAAEEARELLEQDTRVADLFAAFEQNEEDRKTKKPRAPRARVVVHDADSLKALFASLPAAQKEAFMAQLAQ